MDERSVATFQERFAELISGETYQQVSERTFVSVSAVGAYVRGTREPKRSVLLGIARAYGVDPAWLMGYDVPKYKKTPNINVEGLSEEKLGLIEFVMNLSDEEVRVLRGIADQVLSLRGK